ncbi:type VI secretion system baseplate subunit TssE [Cellvibrio sp. OA-2007]|uniref:type VI secretion system baseplate subunit TssE n=1 Tax=Cellvibrio sp. OA-2007 TaxID=529823 RepID=UPI00078411C4|nr:type VI secretion system baseplate subunit TssE [Cellvibrio sp. OA-2007]
MTVQQPPTTTNRIARSNRLTPSLLDRLTDHQPINKREAVSVQGMSKRDYRASVLRDISWLLNTTNADSALPFDELNYAKNSVLNFGVAALSGQYLVDDDRKMIAHSITQTLLTYEPRIIPKSLFVKALPMDDGYAARNQLSLEIKGQLWAEPYPLEFLLRSHIDLEIGLVQLTDILDSSL